MLLLNSIQVTESISWSVVPLAMFLLHPLIFSTWCCRKLTLELGWCWKEVAPFLQKIPTHLMRSDKRSGIWPFAQAVSNLQLSKNQTYLSLPTGSLKVNFWKFGKLAVALWKVIAILHSLTFPLLNSIGKKYLLPQSRKSTVCSWQTSTRCQLSPEKKNFRNFQTFKAFSWVKILSKLSQLSNFQNFLLRRRKNFKNQIVGRNLRIVAHWIGESKNKVDFWWLELVWGRLSVLELNIGRFGTLTGWTHPIGHSTRRLFSHRV